MSRREIPGSPYVAGMPSLGVAATPEPRPRGMLLRSFVAVGLFFGAVLPGWLFAGLLEAWTGWNTVGWLLSTAWTVGAVLLLAPNSSLRPWQVVTAMVPVLGWYLLCVLAWRVAFLPLRDWEPRPDDLWRARWLTGPEHAGLWRSDAMRTPLARSSGIRTHAGTARNRAASRR